MAQNPNIDDDTRARAMKSVEETSADEAPAAKPRVVGKKELEASGLSLRDFMNKERGLTRRGSSAPTETKEKTPAETKEKAPTETKEKAPAASVKMSREDSIAQIPGSSPAGWKGGEGEKVDSTELGRNLSAAAMGQGSGLTTMGKIGAEAMTAKTAANRAMAANAAKEVAARTARVAARREAAGAREALRRDATFEGGMARGGKVRSASSRGDGIAQRGKTRA